MRNFMKRTMAAVILAVLLITVTAAGAPLVITGGRAGREKPESGREAAAGGADLEEGEEPETEDEETEEEEDTEEEPLLPYWTGGSEAAESLVEFVEDACDEESGGFVPEEDRIAVFDLDGTLYCETFPTYFDRTMFLHRVLHDEDYEAPSDMKSFAEKLEKGLETGDMPVNAGENFSAYSALAYKGMTLEEYREYVRECLESDAEGFIGMTRGEAFYRPMVSLVEYLEENGFTVYICSGTERNCVRTQIEDVLDIPANQVIGTDNTLVASGQGGTDGLDYVYQVDDELVLGGELVTKNVKMNKVAVLAQEIGTCPVLSFGNSSGDLSMSEYVTNNAEYEGRAYLLLCDDTEREYGDPDKAAELEELCGESGFYTISMRDDFETIYGEGVRKMEKPGTGEKESDDSMEDETEDEEEEIDEDLAATRKREAEEASGRQSGRVGNESGDLKEEESRKPEEKKEEKQDESREQNRDSGGSGDFLQPEEYDLDALIEGMEKAGLTDKEMFQSFMDLLLRIYMAAQTEPGNAAAK